MWMQPERLENKNVNHKTMTEIKVQPKEASRDSVVLPQVVFGTSGLGNLFVALDDETKCAIVSESVRLSDGPVVFDSAGKYGAGLALEVLGKCLRQLKVSPDKIIISNKLGWLRTELKTEEPTFEPGVWRELKHDAVQKITYDGMMECFEEGNRLLNGYPSELLSVHDPDEYLDKAKDEGEAKKLYADILDAYRALFELKAQGKAKAIGVGAKDWRTIKRIAADVDLDWIMIANSLTVKNHPQELLDFVAEQSAKGVFIIDSAVFHSGFLVGGDYFNYKPVDAATPDGAALLQWRQEFFAVCKEFAVKPAEACVQFALRVPGVKSIALSTTHAERVKDNIAMAQVKIPDAFWEALRKKGLISAAYPDNQQAVS